MKKVVSIFSVLFFLAMFSTIALGADPVLYLDASNNPAHPEAWTNLGTAGGELSGKGKPPVLEQGDIEIPSIGLALSGAKFYTHKKPGQCFGDSEDGMELFLVDWTVEFLCRRNGGKLGGEHQVLGLQTLPPEGQQGIRLRIGGDPAGIEIWIHSEGAKIMDLSSLETPLEEGTWSWITIVGTNEESIVTYQDGVKNNERGGFLFEPAVPLATVVIGANSFWERGRTFNGSFAFVRVYDVALSEAEVLASILGTAVEPDSKLITTWGTVKTEY